MKALLPILLFLVWQQATAQPSSKPFSVTGTIRNANGAVIYLVKNRLALPSGNSAVYVDSARIVNDRFSFTGQIPETSLYSIRIAGVKQVKSFILDEHPVLIEGHVDSLHAVRVTGSPLLSQQTRLAASLSPLVYRMNRYADSSYKYKALQDTVLWQFYADQNQTVARQVGDSIIAFSKQHPGSFVNLRKLSEFSDLIPKDIGQAVWRKLDKSLQERSEGQKLREKLAFSEGNKPEDGQPAPTFAYRNAKGDRITLTDFSGKVVLVQYWASWCAPCQAEHRKLKALYEKYRTKGFEIVSVSVDTDVNKWARAVRKEDLPWTQLSAMAGSPKKPIKIYGEKGIPINMLVDAQGRIIRKGLHEAVLERQLSELFE